MEGKAMGRRPDDPRDQRLKGYPGRRKAKTDAQIAALEEAERVLAATPPSADVPSVSVPAFLDDPEAQAIWREYAPRLERLHVLSVLDHHTFAMFCIYAAQFVRANRDIAAGRKVAAARALRAEAAGMMLGLARKFGLTPVDRHKLVCDHAVREEERFGPAPALPEPRVGSEIASVPACSPPQSLLGLLRQLDSPGPGKPN
jgi:phage terminase small subunit